MAQKRYYYEDVVSLFKDTDLELLSTKDEFQNVLSKIRFKCKEHGEQSVSFSKMLDGRRCPVCGARKCHENKRIPIDDELYRSMCERKDLQYIRAYQKNGRIWIEYICPHHSEFGVQKARTENIKKSLHSKGCPYCYHKKLPEWYVKDTIESKNPNIIMISPYKNMNTKAEFYCKKHDYSWLTKPKYLFTRGHGCYYCGLEKRSQNGFLSDEEFQKIIHQNNPDLTLIKYVDSKTPATVRCEICGEIFSCHPVSLHRVKLCPNCDPVSLGEKRIKQILDEHGIKYITQYKYEDCIDKRPLPFDFYLFDYNILCEFDGLHHYEQRKGWTDLKTVHHHDKIKTEYCEKNNIPLIRIPYWEYDNLECFLMSKFNDIINTLNNS